MKIINRIKGLLFGRLNAEFYRQHNDIILNTNYRILRLGCGFSFVMCVFLFAMSFLSPLVAPLRRFYLFYVAFFAVDYAFVLTLVKKHKKLVPYFFYLFAISILWMVTDIGTLRSPEVPAVTFYVFLIIIPLLYVNRPIYAVGLTVAACAVFAVAAHLVKGDTSVGQNDILNAVCVSIVGIGCDLTILNLQLENIYSKVEFERLSATDELTELPNRRQFGVCVEEMLTQCNKEGKTPVIVMIDVDNFKAYNDAYGHLKGDECLRKISAALQGVALSHGMFLSRYGGEEFAAVYLPSEGDDVASVMNELVKAVEQLQIQNLRNKEKAVTVSIGYVEHCDLSEDCSYRWMLDLADEALYFAKRQGKNRAVRFEKNLQK